MGQHRDTVGKLRNLKLKNSAISCSKGGSKLSCGILFISLRMGKKDFLRYLVFHFDHEPVERHWAIPHEREDPAQFGNSLRRTEVWYLLLLKFVIVVLIRSSSANTKSHLRPVLSHPYLELFIRSLFTFFRSTVSQSLKLIHLEYVQI